MVCRLYRKIDIFYSCAAGRPARKQQEGHPVKKYSVIIGASILFLFMGLIYAWSIFVAPLEADFGWTRSQTSLTFTICMIAFCMGTLSVAPLLKRLRPTWILIAAGGLILAGFLLCSTLNSLAGLYIYYGVICGYAIGCAYSVLLSTVPLWFPGRVGVVNGIVLLAFGVGSLILGSVSTGLIDSVGWRDTFRVLGVAAAALFLACSFFITRPVNALGKGAPAARGTAGEVDTPAMLKRADFWLLFLWLTLISAMGLAVVGHAASIAADAGLGAALVPIAAGVVSVCSGVGRVVSGLLYDRFGVVVTLVVETVWGLGGCLLILAASIQMQTVLLFMGFVLAGLSFGSNPAINATFVRRRYGDRHFTTNFAIMGFQLIPASIIGTFFAGIIRAGSDDYISSILVAAGYVVVAFFLVLGIRKALSAKEAAPKPARAETAHGDVPSSVEAMAPSDS